MDTYTMKIHAKNLNIIEYPKIHAKHNMGFKCPTSLFFNFYKYHDKNIHNSLNCQLDLAPPQTS